jgi:hypothetical protein
MTIKRFTTDLFSVNSEMRFVLSDYTDTIYQKSSWQINVRPTHSALAAPPFSNVCGTVASTT